MFQSGGGGARRLWLHIPDGERTAVVDGKSSIRSSASGKDEGGSDDALHPERVLCVRRIAVATLFVQLSGA